MAAVYERGGVWLPVPKPIPLAQAVRGALLNAMAYTDGRQGEAAGLLGLTPRQMNYQLELYDVPRRYARKRPRRSRAQATGDRLAPRLAALRLVPQARAGG